MGSGPGLIEVFLSEVRDVATKSVATDLDGSHATIIKITLRLSADTSQTVV